MPTGPQQRSWVTKRMPAVPASAAAVRRLLARHLETSPLDADTVADTQLVITELVANAVLHGKPYPDGKIEVGWSVDSDCVHLAVSDAGGPSAVNPRAASVEALNGRGLAIVGALTRTWSVTSTRGTRVNADVCW